MEITEKAGRVGYCVDAPSRESQGEIAGEYEGGWKVRLTAPPVDGRANEALRNRLAARLKVPLAAVRIASGLRSRTQREMYGLTGAMICALAGESGISL